MCSPMKKALTLLLALCASAYAQELLPELKPLAQKYDDDRLAVGASWKKAYAIILEPYSAALTALEKDATAKGQLPIIAAIGKERAALEDGNPAAVSTLPKVETVRRTFMTNLARINADRARATKQVDADYLRVLLALSTRYPANSELQKQIAAEKNRVLESGPTAQAGKNSLVNGDFKDGLTGWDVTSKSVTVENEGDRKFVRFTDLGVVQVVNVPQDAKEFVARAKMRTSGKVPTRSFGIFYVEQKTAEKSFTSNAPGTPNAGWKAFEAKGKIEHDLTKFTVKLWGFPGLPIDVKDCSLEFLK